MRAICERTINVYLSDDEQAALTGWTSRVTAALAHLAEAWCIADPGNAVAAECAIACLITRSTSPRQRETWRRFVVECAGGPGHRGGRGDELLFAIDQCLAKMRAEEA